MPDPRPTIRKLLEASFRQRNKVRVIIQCHHFDKLEDAIDSLYKAIKDFHETLPAIGEAENQELRIVEEKACWKKSIVRAHDRFKGRYDKEEYDASFFVLVEVTTHLAPKNKSDIGYWLAFAIRKKLVTKTTFIFSIPPNANYLQADLASPVDWTELPL